MGLEMAKISNINPSIGYSNFPWYKLWELNLDCRLLLNIGWILLKDKRYWESNWEFIKKTKYLHIKIWRRAWENIESKKEYCLTLSEIQQDLRGS
jgi:hypothetical protein